MHREPARLRDELDLVGLEVEPGLHVRARDREHRRAREVAGKRSVDVTCDHAPYLRMPPQDVAECAPVGRRQALAIPHLDTGRDRRVVDGAVYSAVVAMVALTTLMTPPLLAWRMRGARHTA